MKKVIIILKAFLLLCEGVQLVGVVHQDILFMERGLLGTFNGFDMKVRCVSQLIFFHALFCSLTILLRRPR